MPTESRERIRLSVMCGDDLRFYELLCPSATTAPELEQAIRLSVEAFAQSFDRELNSRRCKAADSNKDCVEAEA